MRPSLVAVADLRRSLPAYVSRAIGIGVIVCALSVLGYLFLVRARIGSFAFGSLGDFGREKPVTVALFDSSATRSYMASLPGASADGYDRILETWEGLLDGAGTEWHRVTARDLERGLDPSSVLVLPAAGALAGETVSRIEAFVRRGGGLVATWQLALRDEKGQWRGFDLLNRWLYFDNAGWEGKDAPRYVTLRAGRALTAGIDAGTRLALYGFDRPLLGYLPGAVGLWTDWAMNPIETNGRSLGAIAAASLGRGRLVWFSFPVTLVGRGDHEQRILRHLVSNAVHWVARRPLVHLLEWPEGAPVAALFAMDTEFKFTNASAVAKVFADALAPVTFFCLSKLALSYPKVIEQLAGAGEIGSHTDNHKPLAGLSLAEQLAHLERSRRDLSALSGQPVRGFRPPEEKVDENTVPALRRAGYWYLAGDPQKPAAVPSLKRGKGHPLMIVPRVPLDDYDLIGSRDEADPGSVADELKAEFDRVRSFGGLFFMSFHTEWLGQERYLPVLREAIQYARANGAWLGTFGDLYHWWTERDGLRVALHRLGPTRLGLGITNEGVAEVRGATLAVYLGRQARSVTVKADKIPAPRVSYELDAEGERLVIELAVIPGGASDDYFIDFEDGPGG